MLDFRSDTVTKPTEEMRKAMYEAEVGDDVYEDDITVNTLEEKLAKMLGKEAGLFVPSGTFSNQLALATHTKKGEEVIVMENSHIMIDEVGAAGMISGITIRGAKCVNGGYDMESLRHVYREDEDIHFPDTTLICMEVAHGNGSVCSIDHMKEVYDFAKEREVPVHLDGARIFNAAISLGVDASEIAKYADTISVCISKGLASPIGSILVGSKAFIARARRYRKLMGGGLRQVGVLAAPGHISLDKMIDRLKEDHDNAQYFSKEIAKFDCVEVMADRVDINMVFFKLFKDIKLEEVLLKEGILINGAENDEYRIVMHNDVDRKAVDKLLESIKKYVS